MSRVYVGNLDPRITERDLEDEFRIYGVLRSVWVARRPPGYAFIEFDDRRDALDAIRELDGKNGWRVELSHNSSGRGGGRGGRGRGGDDLKCYECGVTALVENLLEVAAYLLVVDAATAGRPPTVGAAMSPLMPRVYHLAVAVVATAGPQHIVVMILLMQTGMVVLPPPSCFIIIVAFLLFLLSKQS